MVGDLKKKYTTPDRGFQRFFRTLSAWPTRACLRGTHLSWGGEAGRAGVGSSLGLRAATSGAATSGSSVFRVFGSERSLWPFCPRPAKKACEVPHEEKGLLILLFVPRGDG